MAARTGSDPASSSVAPTPCAARATRSVRQRPGEPGDDRRRGEDGDAGDDERQRPHPAVEQGHRDGRDGDRERVRREDPRDADDRRVELAVQVGEGEGDDGRVGERQPDRTDDQRGDEALPRGHGVTVPTGPA